MSEDPPDYVEKTRNEIRRLVQVVELAIAGFVQMGASPYEVAVYSESLADCRKSAATAATVDDLIEAAKKTIDLEQDIYKALFATIA